MNDLDYEDVRTELASRVNFTSVLVNPRESAFEGFFEELWEDWSQE